MQNADYSAMCEQIGQLTGRVDQLSDLFRRRLLNDKVQAQALSALTEQLSKQRLAPLCREFILLLDRIELSNDDLVRSVYEEVYEVLSHYGLEQVPASSMFSPAVQRIVDVREDDSATEDYVVEVRRQGYTLNGVLLRPQDVVIARPSHKRASQPPLSDVTNAAACPTQAGCGEDQ